MEAKFKVKGGQSDILSMKRRYGRQENKLSRLRRQLGGGWGGSKIDNKISETREDKGDSNIDFRNKETREGNGDSNINFQYKGTVYN